LSTLFGHFPFLRKLFADSAYTGPVFQACAAKVMHSLAVEIVKRGEHAKGFVVEPKRWIVIACTIVPGRALSGPKGSNAVGYGPRGVISAMLV
jgi:hypothetical protein